MEHEHAGGAPAGDEPVPRRRRRRQWVMPDGRPSDTPPDEAPGVRQRRRARLVVAALAGYFGLLVTPAFHAPVLRSTLSWLYLLSLLLVLLGLAVAGVAGLVGHLRARSAGEGGEADEGAWEPWHRSLLVVSVCGFVLFGASVTATRWLARGLPLGSYAAPFDGEVWRRAGAAEPVHGDLTPRQKMVGDLVDNVLPGKTRAEIEAALGPVAATRYLAATGRDILYLLGLERGPVARDAEWLLIWLDADGRFQRAAVVND